MNKTDGEKKEVNLPVSLRDYFAGQALVGFLSQLSSNKYNKAFIRQCRVDKITETEGTALSCYLYADAMITERNK